MVFINLENILGIPSASSAFLPLNWTCSIWGMFVSCLLPNWAHDSTSINSSFQFSLLCKLNVLEIDTHLKNKLLYIIQLWMWYSSILQLWAGSLPNTWVYVSLLVFKMHLPTDTRLRVMTRAPGIPLNPAEAWANEVQCYLRQNHGSKEKKRKSLTWHWQTKHIGITTTLSASLRRHVPIILPFCFAMMIVGKTLFDC